MNIFLRSVISQDAPMLLRWRNDPETRRNSINTGEVTPEEHALWMNRVLVEDVYKAYVASADDIPVGVVRLEFDFKEKTCDLSFTVAPERRGRGYGSAMVAHALHGLGDVCVTAEVKMFNQASRRIFDKLGFRVIDSAGELLLYAKDMLDCSTAPAAISLPNRNAIAHN